MTQFPEAKAGRCDATFFPRVEEGALAEWEERNGLVLPEDWREFYQQSNGMEATKGEWFPVVGLESCEVWLADCRREAPWVGFGEVGDVKFYLNLAIERSVFSIKQGIPEPEFFCTGLECYFEKVFRGRV